MPKNKKLTLFWFSVRDRKFVRPNVNYAFNVGLEEIRESQRDISKDFGNPLPNWATEVKIRKSVVSVTSIILVLMWIISLSNFPITWQGVTLSGL